MRRLLFILFIFVCGVMLVACSKHIEDTNGADITPETISDEDIVSGNDSSMSSGRKSSTRNDRGEISIEKFSGVQTVDTVNVREGEETLTYKIAVESGNFRAVIVKDGAIYAELTVDGEEHKAVMSETGKYDFKIVGESAMVKVEYKVK